MTDGGQLTLLADQNGSPPFGPANGSAACSACRRDTSGEITWLGEAGLEICQECWEAECSRSWWKMVEQLDKLGLLEAPPNH
jgi:hypothetical protein